MSYVTWRGTCARRGGFSTPLPDHDEDGRAHDEDTRERLDPQQVDGQIDLDDIYSLTTK